MAKDITVMPTDTIYGIVGSALNPATVEKIYKLRKRALDKPMIILISSIEDLNKFEIQLTEGQKKILQRIWPNPISVILPINSQKFVYLHRGKNSLAFRMPKDESLLALLKSVGPIVAPSANFEGEKSAETIDEARKYFGDQVDYIDGGFLKAKPSTLIKLTNDSFEILRQGNITLDEIKKLLE